MPQYLTYSVQEIQKAIPNRYKQKYVLIIKIGLQKCGQINRILTEKLKPISGKCWVNIEQRIDKEVDQQNSKKIGR